jgi:hypothetical protein
MTTPQRGNGRSTGAVNTKLSVAMQFGKEASQTRDYCVAKSTRHRAALPDPSAGKKHPTQMTTKLRHYSANTKLSRSQITLVTYLFVISNPAPPASLRLPPALQFPAKIRRYPELLTQWIN